MSKRVSPRVIEQVNCSKLMRSMDVHWVFIPGGSRYFAILD